MREHNSQSIDPAGANVADARLVFARTCGASSWTRLVHAVRLADAIWRDDLQSVRQLITQNAALIPYTALFSTVVSTMRGSS